VVGSKQNPPKSPAAYTVQVPAGNNYYFFGIIDNNNNGLMGVPGQISNTHSNGAASVAINGSATLDLDLTPYSANSQATVMTNASEQINQGAPYYNIDFSVYGLFKLPVAVELATGPSPGVVIPADIANGGFYGNSDQFQYWASLNGATPQVGDTYTLNVTYSDGTSEVLTAVVSTVLNAFATNLSPQGSGASVTPNFSWTDPQNASSYTYQFWLCCDNNNNTIWQIPANNSHLKGFSSSITSITWGVDPLNSGNLPDMSSLNGSTNYTWQIQATDANGNSAQVQVSFQTVATPLSLPPGGSVGTAVVGQGWSGSINASGGVGPYTFTVNGTTVTNGNPVGLGDNLFASNNGSNTLTLSGTPTSSGTVSFTVSVTDSQSGSAGPNTYTITVNPAASCTNNANLNGRFAFLMQGWTQPHGGGNYVYWGDVGSMVADGIGNITSGEYEFDDSADGPISGTFTGSYCIVSNNTGTMTTTDTSGHTSTMAFVVQSNGNGKIINYDATNIMIWSGVFYKQDTTAFSTSKISGNYAFGLVGVDGTPARQGIAGEFNSNGNGTLSGMFDVNDAGNYTGQVTLTASNFAVTSGTTGRGTVTLVIGGGSASLPFTFYVVNASQLLMVETEPLGSGNAEMTGQIQKQSGLSGNNSDVNGVSVFEQQQLDNGCSTPCPEATLGFITANGSGSFTFSGDDNDGSTMTTQSGSGTYTVASNGRVATTMNGVNHPPVFYLYAKNTGFMVESQGGQAVGVGLMEAQSGSNFNGSSLSGNFYGGSWQPQYFNGCVDLTLLNVTPGSGSSASGSVLDEDDCGSGPGSGSLTFTATVSSNGRVLVTPSGGGGGNNGAIVYIISPSSGGTGGKFVSLGNGDNNPKLESFQQ